MHIYVYDVCNVYKDVETHLIIYIYIYIYDIFFKNDLREFSVWCQQLRNMGETCNLSHWGFGRKCYPNARK